MGRKVKLREIKKVPNKGIGFLTPNALCPNTLEKRIEQRLVDRAKMAGGLAMKWVSPAFAGVPDRIVFLPGGRILFVELKAPGQKPTALQARVHRMLADLGADVRVVDSKEGVDALFT